MRQGYYLGLPNSQKHNPGNRSEDPFTSIKIESFEFEDINNFDHDFSSFSADQVKEIIKLIERLEKEIKSSWPYPNKERKVHKVEGLISLLIKSTTMDPKTAVEQVERAFPEIRTGSISTRTADLLDSLKNDGPKLQT